MPRALFRRLCTSIFHGELTKFPRGSFSCPIVCKSQTTSFCSGEAENGGNTRNSDLGISERRDSLEVALVLVTTRKNSEFAFKVADLTTSGFSLTFLGSSKPQQQRQDRCHFCTFHKWRLRRNFISPHNSIICCRFSPPGPICICQWGERSRHKHGFTHIFGKIHESLMMTLGEKMISASLLPKPKLKSERATQSAKFFQ